MPWVKQELCTGCETCVETCPTGAIELDSGGLAAISDDQCIRCGTCHDVCPEEAVRHDGERIPQDVAANLQWVRRLLDHYETASQQAAFMDRIGRHFKKEAKVIEKTSAALKTVSQDTAAQLDAAIRSALEPQDQNTN